MELYEEILSRILSSGKMHVIFSNPTINAAELIESESYKALKKIKDILSDDRLSDGECFQKIEEIICVFEALGSNGGSRHDSG